MHLAECCAHARRRNVGHWRRRRDWPVGQPVRRPGRARLGRRLGPRRWVAARPHGRRRSRRKHGGVRHRRPRPLRRHPAFRLSLTSASRQRFVEQLAHLGAPFATGRNHAPHLFELAEAEQPVLALESSTLLRVRDDDVAASQGQHGDVPLAETRFCERLPDKLRTFGHVDFGDADELVMVR